MSDNLKARVWALFKPALVAMIVALLVSMGYHGLTQQQAPLVSVQGTTHYGSLYLTGDLGVAGTSSLTGGYTWSGLGTSSNGLQVTGNTTSTLTTNVLRYGVAVISTTLDANTVNVTDQLTTGAGIDVGGAAEITGTITGHGVATIAGLVTASNGLTASQITVTAGVTVGTYVGALSFYGAISSTVAITNAQVIPYTGKLIIPVTVADGGVGGSIAGTLNSTDSISDGTYLGEILYIVNVDADTDTLVIKDAANTELGASDLTLGPQDSCTLYWDGSVWRIVAKCDV